MTMLARWARQAMPVDIPLAGLAPPCSSRALSSLWPGGVRGAMHCSGRTAKLRS